MAARATGFALLPSGSVQEAADLALIAHAAAHEWRIPFVHFFDGLRTSHKIVRNQPPSAAQLRAMIDDDLVRAHRERGLSPDHPFIRGTAQYPDVYFQGREAVNPFYLVCPAIMQTAMDRFAGITGRRYRLLGYAGSDDAERVLVLMRSGPKRPRKPWRRWRKRAKRSA